MKMKIIFGGLLTLLIGYQCYSFTNGNQLNDMATISDKFKSSILSKQSGLTPPERQDLKKIMVSFAELLVRPSLEVFEQTAVSQNVTKDEKENDVSWSLIDTPDGIDLGQTLVRNQRGRLFVQAPHQFSDMLTGEIALAAMQHSQNSDALFLNNQHRSEIDYSRLTESILTHLTQNYIDLTPEAIVIQLHGFDQKIRRSKLTQQANFIISSGSNKNRQLPRELKQCLDEHGFENILVFGDEAHELGATQNPVKNRMYQMQYSKFLHIEMSLEQRKEFVKNSEEIARFYRCLDIISDSTG